MMNNRIKAPAIAVAAVIALSGCNLLDVDNPNSLVEGPLSQSWRNGVRPLGRLGDYERQSGRHRTNPG